MTDPSQVDRSLEGPAADDRPQSRLFEVLSRELLRSGNGIRFQARGASMSPAIRDGEIVHVKSAALAELRAGDIVLAKAEMGFRLHRLMIADYERDVYITRGDCGQQDDPAVGGEQIVGVARAKEVRVGRKSFAAKFRGVRAVMLRSVARGQHVVGKAWQITMPAWLRAVAKVRKASRTVVSVLSLAVLLLAASSARAQVAVDNNTSVSAELTGPGSQVVPAFNHKTGNAGVNRLMLVGVSMNITNSPTAGVVGITYNGATLNFVGAHNDAGNTRRVEMWYLKAPSTGNKSVVVTLNIPAAQTVGVVVGVTTFTGADQTASLGTFVSADGTAGGNSQLDVPSVTNGMILDTLAIGGNQTVTIPGPQVSEWNVASGGADPPDVTGSGSSRTGAPSVPISESFSGASNWSLGAVSVNPSTADIAVTTSVSAVALGQHSVYNITVTNNGPSAANTVTLTDTYASTGLSIVSVAPSTGTTCVTGATIVCTLPASFASGATATVAVTVATTTAGFYSNTAVLTDSGTPPDPNTGNNTFVALAPVVSVVCSGATLSAGGTLSGQVNTYYPGNGNAAKGATSIPLGAANGAGTIANGSLLLVIQMQDASISTNNDVTYGNGSTGTGFTALNNSGNYEFVTATGAISGGSVPIKGAGPTNGLVFAYTSAAASTTKGQSTYQVVLVPQYRSAVEWVDGRNPRARHRRTTESGGSDGIGRREGLSRRRRPAVDRRSHGRVERRLLANFACNLHRRARNRH